MNNSGRDETFYPGNHFPNSAHFAVTWALRTCGPAGILSKEEMLIPQPPYPAAPYFPHTGGGSERQETIFVVFSSKKTFA